MLLLILALSVAASACKTEKKYNPKKCRTCPHFWLWYGRRPLVCKEKRHFIKFLFALCAMHNANIRVSPLRRTELERSYSTPLARIMSILAYSAFKTGKMTIFAEIRLEVMTGNIYCVIMAGGLGTRFWPMSRTLKPKQFIDVLGMGKTLIQLTFDRLLKVCPAENILVVTN